MTGTAPQARSAAPTLGQLFLAFAKVAMTSFGGGLSGWMMQELVRRRAWVSEQEFITGLAISQALPGVNVVNQAIWIGYRLQGSRGALVCALGMVVPPMFFIIGMSAIYEQIAGYPQTALVLAGAASSAIGMALAMSLRAARYCVSRVVPVAVMAATFAAIALLHVPLIEAVLVAAPVSIILAYVRPPADV